MKRHASFIAALTILFSINIYGMNTTQNYHGCHNAIITYNLMITAAYAGLRENINARHSYAIPQNQSLNVLQNNILQQQLEGKKINS